MGSSLVAVTWTSDFVPVSSKEFLDIQATIECEFTLERVRDMIRAYSIIFCFIIVIRKAKKPFLSISYDYDFINQ